MCRGPGVAQPGCKPMSRPSVDSATRDYRVAQPGAFGAVVTQSPRNRRSEVTGHIAIRLDRGELRAKMATQSLDGGAQGRLDLRGVDRPGIGQRTVRHVWQRK
ncbi:hypothetical protein GCM10009764_24590 [Nocardia ninae]|uniref:Uncharacterized protein n=1 Tax=Nocardia ninae NBRC 108245 TaxID=1210091 RepID=A0A511MGQ2_9NOCA|nr:hypothetical protein NN4_36050 [Nocardia ninae NBRC 108245]